MYSDPLVRSRSLRPLRQGSPESFDELRRGRGPITLVGVGGSAFPYRCERKVFRFGQLMKAYQPRFYPTLAQRRQLARAFNACRYGWNWALDRRTKIYRQAGASLNAISL